jgi:hypothetical protein
VAAERLAPDALLDQTNLSGSVADVDDDPDSPDGSWLVHDGGNGNTICRVSFPSPTGNPTTGSGLQEFRVQIRKNASAGNATPWSLQLWEGGSQVAELATGTVTTTTGEVVSGTWDASSLSGSDGADVECRLEQTNGGASGSGTNRRRIEVGAVEWNAEYSESLPAIEGTLSASLDDASLSAEATATDPPLTATLSATLDVATAAAFAESSIGASLAVELDGATVAADAEAPVTAALSTDLSAATVAAAGEGTEAEPPVEAELSATLAGANLVASGVAQVAASLAGTLDSATATGAAVAPVDGSLAVTLAAASVSAAASAEDPPNEATLSATLDAAQIDASASAPVTATATVELGAATLDAAGALPVAAEMDADLAGATVAASAFSGDPPVLAELSMSLDAATVTAGAVAPVAGAVIAALDSAAVSATVSVPAVASMSAQLTAAACSAQASAEDEPVPVEAIADTERQALRRGVMTAAFASGWMFNGLVSASQIADAVEAGELVPSYSCSSGPLLSYSELDRWQRKTMPHLRRPRR